MNKKYLFLAIIPFLTISSAYALDGGLSFDEFCDEKTINGKITAADFICELDIFQMKDDITSNTNRIAQIELRMSNPVIADFVGISSGASLQGCEESNECFYPYEATIHVNDTLEWTNYDTAAHTVTSGAAGTGPDGIFDSGLIISNSKFLHTFDTAGTFVYYCMVHPWANGIVIVSP